MDDLIQQIVGLIQSGRKIEAIKLYHEATGKSLQEAKDDIERMSSGVSVSEAATAPASSAVDVPDDVRQLALAGNTIEAIKKLREHQEMGLKEAKDIVDGIAGVKPTNARPGCVIALAILIAAIGVIVAIFMASR